MGEHEKVIPRQQQYRYSESLQMVQLAYDVTMRFCDLHIERSSRMQLTGDFRVPTTHLLEARG